MIISIILGALLLILCIYIFLISPSWSAGRAFDFFEKNRYFAHRGLHGDGIPENSLAAFRRACEAGYGIELDVHLTADEKLVVFHDDTLTRMCGTDGTPEEKTLAELRELSLAGTDERIPSFDEVLALISGRVPLIVELKGRSTKDMRICKAVSERMKSYGGKWCMEAFNPFYVRWFRKNDRSVVRGQLSCRMKGEDGTGNAAQDFILRNLLLSFLARPHFIAYSVADRKSFALHAAKLCGGCPVGWTVRSDEEMEKACGFNAVIFEKIRP